MLNEALFFSLLHCFTSADSIAEIKMIYYMVIVDMNAVIEVK